MNTLRIVLIALVVNSAFTGYSQQELLLRGRIGSLPVVMAIKIYDSSCSGLYYYESQRRDIPFEGHINKRGEFRLSTPVYDSAQVPEVIVLRKKGDGYAGSWQKLRKLPVSLEPVSVNSFKSPYDHLARIRELKRENSYAYLKLAGLRFIKDSGSRHGAVVLDWYREQYSGIRLPRLRSGYSNSAIRQMNHELFITHLYNSEAALSCSNPYGTSYELMIDHIYAGKEVFSINLFVHYDCGGAHPDFVANGLNLDARTGKQLTLDQVYHFDKESPPPESSDAWFEYREVFFAPALVWLLTRLYPQEMKPADEESCAYADPEVWKFPNWYFTEKGVYFGAGFGRAMRACDYPEWSVIPYKDLMPYLVLPSPPAELTR